VSSPYRVPLDQLEQERVLRSDQVVLRGDGMGPPPVTSVGIGDDGAVHADGDGD
jgi:hypothetical protein